MIRFLQLGLTALFTVLFCFSLMENASATIEYFIAFSMIGLVSIPLFDPSTFGNRRTHEHSLVLIAFVVVTPLVFNVHLSGGIAGAACIYLVGAEIAYTKTLERKRRALIHACTVFQTMGDAQRSLIVLHMRKLMENIDDSEEQNVINTILDQLLVSENIIPLLQKLRIDYFSFIAQQLIRATETNPTITFVEEPKNGKKKFVPHLPKTKDIEILGV